MDLISTPLAGATRWLHRQAGIWLRVVRRGTLLVLAVSGCAAPGNPYYDQARSHHTPEGFRNNYLDGLGNSGGSFWKWQWERTRDGLPKPPANAYRFEQVKPDVAWIKANRSQTAATWIGAS